MLAYAVALPELIVEIVGYLLKVCAAILLLPLWSVLYLLQWALGGNSGRRPERDNSRDET